MNSWNLRSLLLAAIVLSSCITWTASRHHYTHNVLGHRSRHRRQGAGLFHPSSYVIPQGDGTGAWGEWGEVSSCSRSCGGGVAYQKRICLEIGLDGQPLCTGGDTKYFSCETQDCPSGSKDFRAEQCAEFNRIPFNGSIFYEWVPYTRGLNPCELNCMPKTERFYYRHRKHVVDGTRCTDDSYDVCVNGICQPAGCDMMIGSNSKEDKCLRCRGNGTNCNTLGGLIDSQDYRQGYNDVLLIPENATTVIIHEIKPSNNYLALRNLNNVFYLNGNYRIDFPRILHFAGMTWQYERNPQGFAAPDTLRCQGPTTEPLYLSLLVQDVNVGIEFEYSLPQDQMPHPHEKYNWVYGTYSECSATCGGGSQTREVTCRSDDTLEIVEENLCDKNLKPSTRENCNMHACAPYWKEGPWGECTRRCGKDGYRTRTVHCEKVIINGVPSIVADEECFNILGPKPANHSKCNENAKCPSWYTEPWKPCDKLCDQGKKTRLVVCHQKIDGKVIVLDDSECKDEKPLAEESCMIRVCKGVDWVLSEWIGCDTCLSTNRTRKGYCVTKDRVVVDDTFCAHHTPPVLEEPCELGALPGCQTQWYATQWGNCSVECGKGFQKRMVFCGRFDGATVMKVDDKYCDIKQRYNDTKNCEVPPEKCPAKWFVGPWEKCDKPCDGGTQHRTVMCLLGGEISEHCVPDSNSPVLSQSCNKHPCNTDEMLPVNPSLESILDDYDEDCEYPEYGAEEDTSFTTTDMFSDTTSTLEGSGASTDIESEFTDITETKAGSMNVDYTVSEYTDSTETEYTGSPETEDTDGTETNMYDTNETTETGETSESVETENSEIDISKDSTEQIKTLSDNMEISTEETEKQGITINSTETSAASNSLASDSSTVPSYSESSISTETGTSESITSSESIKYEESEKTTNNYEWSSSKPTVSTESGSSGSMASSESTEVEVTTEDNILENSTFILGSSEFSTSESIVTKETTEFSTIELQESQSTESTETEESVVTEFLQSSATTEFTSATEKALSEPYSSSEISTLQSEAKTNTFESSTVIKTSSELSTSESSFSENITEYESTTETFVSTETSESNLSPSTIEFSKGPTETFESSSLESSTTEFSEGSTESSESSSSGPSTTEFPEVSQKYETKTESTTETFSSTETSESSSLASSTTEFTEGSTETSESSSSGSSTTEFSEDSEKYEIESENTTETFSSTESSEAPSTTEFSEGSTETSESSSLGPETTEFLERSTETSESSSLGPSTTEFSEGSTETSESSSLGPSSTEFSEGSTETSESSSLGPSTTEFSEGSTETSESSSLGPSTTEFTEGSTKYEEETESITETSETSTSEFAVSETTEITSVGTRETETGTESTPSIEVTEETVTSETTPWTWVSTMKIFTSTHKKHCRPAKHICSKTLFGCCPDKKTPAKGPFDEGCNEPPETCKETKYGCCPDGVSPARGLQNKGCPTIPCTETLFGCCKSDNKTAAEGNDQEGCPPSMPACVSSKFGCCEDRETEAKGPNAEGCFEETTTETTQPEESCETSEYGCCPDNSTQATGPNQEGCPGCDTTEFGCCADNRTRATGPNQEGCPCNTTQFGCCPDGVTPAGGAQMEGCVLSCNTSAYGCCPDNETPAHGPDYEGCCLLYPYGCCPDNFKPAEEPHQFKGCGCSFARFGCCPDNETIARGPNNQGCGCKYTQFGCCPDGHTEAKGPKFEGCGCHTYQFGCCPDGFTHAEGPNQQGCLCRTSLFGCCPDEKTFAAGPDFLGCDCTASKYGCCPDGKTAALGEKFHGCTDLPVNRQAACGLDNERGECRNFSKQYYYNTEYGGCSPFWYGGCGGNDNRFETEKECEDICIQPPPKDACRLPAVKGSCPRNVSRWYYDTAREQCMQFVWSGCLGNSNNFDSIEQCQQQCSPPKTDDPCKLPIDGGSCRGNFGRWGFNAETGRCEQFIWGGCEGNKNRFKTEAACVQTCDPPGTLKPECMLPQESGKCSEKHAVWSFSQTVNRCVPFYYTGCGGNKNRFDSEQACSERCPSAYVQDDCRLPASAGDCDNYSLMWYYDTADQRCTQFYWGGCGGNGNRFKTEDECAHRCSEATTTLAPRPSPTTLPTTPTTQAPQTQPEPQVHDDCRLPASVGDCDNYVLMWYYDTAIQRCRQFYWGGCGGNGNRFNTEDECAHRCIEATTTLAPRPSPTILPTTPTTQAPQTQPEPQVQDDCRLPASVGDCDNYVLMWYYDTAIQRCSQFYWGGCGGNGNRFQTEVECMHRCTEEVTTLAPRPLSTPQTLEFKSESCFLEKEHGPCTESEIRWFYEASRGTCLQFEYGGCGGNENNFYTLEDCQRFCHPVQDVCQLPMRSGSCDYSLMMWFYDSAHDRCSQFTYSGCDGNDNRFQTEEDCERRCRTRVPPQPEPQTEQTPTTTITFVPPQCQISWTMEPCTVQGDVWYLDTALRQCVVHQNINNGTSCRTTGTFSNLDDCQRACSEFPGFILQTTSPCELPQEGGNCLGEVVMWYYDSASKVCDKFIYTGCGGNENKFDTREDCEAVCSQQQPPIPSTPPPVPKTTHHPFIVTKPVEGECLTPPSLEPCGRNVSVYYFDSTHHKCLPAPIGDCPYLNRYRSEEECERSCGEYKGIDVCRYNLDPGTCRDNVVTKFYWNINTGLCESFAYGGCGGSPNRFSTEIECYEVCRNTGPVAPTTSTTLPPLPLPVPDCTAYKAECSAIQCEYGINRVRTSNGCERCSCVQVEVDCSPLVLECKQLKCTYFMERVRGVDGCERCHCTEHPCEGKYCPDGERCIPITYLDPITTETRYSAECRIANKPGRCPTQGPSLQGSCHLECNDDADCPGNGKCCKQGCSQRCVVPDLGMTTLAPFTTHAPDQPFAPQIDTATQPEVEANEGGKAVLRCLFHSNPPPKITWMRGQILIDSSVDRYRLLSDGTLEIVSLYRNDSGVYICVADNGLGVARHEVRLQVNDPVEIAANIAGDRNAVVKGEIGSPLMITCHAYGYPPPSITWYHGVGTNTEMVPFLSQNFEARGNVLTIRHLTEATLGIYICDAYNAVGEAASWTVKVEAIDNNDIDIEQYVPPVILPTVKSTVTIPPTTLRTSPPDYYPHTVRVTTKLVADQTTIPVGGELNLPCEVDGYPTPEVYWTKDEVPIHNDNRITVTDARLTISNVNTGDSGVYGCHAMNRYYSDVSTVGINVRGVYIPPYCTDNPLFANCTLIVHSKFCRHRYYSTFCCKSCAEAGQLNPEEIQI